MNITKYLYLKLPNEVTITEGTTDSTGLQALIDISDGDEEVFTETVVQT